MVVSADGMCCWEETLRLATCLRVLLCNSMELAMLRCAGTGTCDQ